MVGDRYQLYAENNDEDTVLNIGDTELIENRLVVGALRDISVKNGVKMSENISRLSILYVDKSGTLQNLLVPDGQRWYLSIDDMGILKFVNFSEYGEI